ncbi:MAG: hypothetical protein AAF567_24500 [Actinomycetota bacterium]
MRRTRDGHTRVFWVTAELADVVSLGWLENATAELTGALAMPGAIRGWSPIRRTGTIRGVGSYFSTNDYREGTLRFYDDDQTIAGLFPPDVATYGQVVFLWDAEPGPDGIAAGGAGGRYTIYRTSTLGRVWDGPAENAAATWHAVFAIIGRPDQREGLEP